GATVSCPNLLVPTACQAILRGSPVDTHFHVRGQGRAAAKRPAREWNPGQGLVIGLTPTVNELVPGYAPPRPLAIWQCRPVSAQKRLENKVFLSRKRHCHMR